MRLLMAAVNTQPNSSEILFFEYWKSGPGLTVHSAATVTLFMLGLPLNTWALWQMVKDTGGRVGSDIFALNLVVMELYYCLISPLYSFSIYYYNMHLLSFMSFFIGFIVAGQPMFQCCICVEQYLAVVHPITYLKYKPLRYRVMCSGAVWLLAACIGGLSFWNFNHTIYTFPSVCVVILAVDLFCSFSILKALRRPGPGEGEREGMNLMKKKAFTIVLINQAIMLVNYIPLPLVMVAGLKGIISIENFYLAYGVAYFLFMSGSFVQPLMYLNKAGKLPCLQ